MAVFKRKTKSESSKKGFVYLLTNPAMPGLVKIGMTTRTPEIRLRELNATTSLPYPFKLVGAVKTKDAAVLEKTVHDTLESRRANRKREFFKITVSQAESIIRNEAGKVGATLRAPRRIRRGRKQMSQRGRRRAPNSFLGNAIAGSILLISCGILAEYVHPGTLHWIESLFFDILATIQRI